MRIHEVQGVFFVHKQNEQVRLDLCLSKSVTVTGLHKYTTKTNQQIQPSRGSWIAPKQLYLCGNLCE